MNTIKKFLGASAIALASLSASASDITIGAVTWDPDFNDGFSMDFGATTNFQQWFTTDDTTVSQYIDGDAITGAVVAGTANTELVGLGEFTLLNGLDTSGFLCAGCELTFAFGGILFDGVSFDVSNSWITLYSDFSADFITSPGDWFDAQDGDVWLSGSFDSFGLIAGNILNGFSEALISVNGGQAFGNFDTNGQPIGLGGSDLKLSASANYLTNPVYSNVASADVVGNTIPEPTSIALFGLSLLGLAGVARRKQS